MSEVRPHVVQRILDGERGLTLATADNLAFVLGLKLIPREAHARNTETTTGCTRILRCGTGDAPDETTHGRRCRQELSEDVRDLDAI